MDECKEDLHNCTDLEICINRIGSFHCNCITGYQKRNSNKCEGEDIKNTFKSTVILRHCINKLLKCV